MTDEQPLSSFYDPAEIEQRQEQEKRNAHRALRGSVYLARLRVIRLTHAWPADKPRTPEQEMAITEAWQKLEQTIARARAEGVEEGVAPTQEGDAE